MCCTISGPCCKWDIAVNIFFAPALAGLTKLNGLWITDNPDLTSAEIWKLRKALPKCKIIHNAEKCCICSFVFALASSFLSGSIAT